MKSINPATGRLINEYSPLTTDELDARVQQASSAFGNWRRTSFRERADLMRGLAEQLHRSTEEAARLITDEMGKPISQSKSEIEKCAWVCDFYADRAEAFLKPQPVETDASRSFVRFDPLGPVLAVMPWNFPFWQVFRFAAPALMAGNVGLLKHASNVSGCAMEIERLFRAAGFPPGVFTTLLIESGQVENVIRHPAIRAVTLTGSENAGRKVAAAAGEQLKKTVLELGGSDPFIVLADADLDEAARQAVRARTINTGQSCIAAKRFIVAESVLEPFLEAMRREMESLTVGDPTQDETQIGPIAREDLLAELHDQVQRSLSAGARLVCGGERLNREGFYYAPTILRDVSRENPAFQEELFGPVAAVVAAENVDQAIELANASSYGLGASLWSGDVDRALELAARVESGAVFINEIVKSDPRVPFGGVKNSGYGRELGEFGIREFVNIKTVWAA